jgi:hypothetical protein
MKIIGLLAIAAAILAGGSLKAQTWVNGYERQNGTHVDGYYRSNPNNTTIDNYSTRGNYNPYTGREGTRSYDGLQHYGSHNYGCTGFRGYR